MRKYPDESDLRQEGSIWGHSLKVQTMLVGEPKGQELEAARKKITRLLVLASFFLPTQSKIPAHRMAPPSLRAGLPTSSDLIKITFIGVPRG